MKVKNKREIRKDWVIIILLILILIAVLFYNKITQSRGSICLNNPFIYSAQEAQDITNSEVLCSCSFKDNKYNPFYFDNNSIIK